MPALILASSSARSESLGPLVAARDDVPTPAAAGKPDNDGPATAAATVPVVPRRNWPRVSRLGCWCRDISLLPFFSKRTIGRQSRNAPAPSVLVRQHEEASFEGTANLQHAEITSGIRPPRRGPSLSQTPPSKASPLWPARPDVPQRPALPWIRHDIPCGSTSCPGTPGRGRTVPLSMELTHSRGLTRVVGGSSTPPQDRTFAVLARCTHQQCGTVRVWRAIERVPQRGHFEIPVARDLVLRRLSRCGIRAAHTSLEYAGPCLLGRQWDQIQASVI